VESTRDYGSLGEGSSPSGSAYRSVAQRQSIGPTNRGAQVRVLPDRRWSWCSGLAFLTVTQADPVRLRMITPGQMWATAAQLPVKQRPSGTPRPTRGSGSQRMLPVADPPLSFRNSDASFDSRRKHSGRASHWRGRRSAKPPVRGPIPRRGSGGPKPTGLRQPPPKGKTARSTRAGPAARCSRCGRSPNTPARVIVMGDQRRGRYR
jgi:hypothetical protein